MTEFIPRISISIGDYKGIGPEVILKTLADKVLISHSTPIILAPKSILEQYTLDLFTTLSCHFPNNSSDIKDGIVNVLDLETTLKDSDFEEKEKEHHSGKFAMKSIEAGIRLCMNNNAHALVTAPISKEAVNIAGYKIPGHTEFLASKTNTNEVLMMLVSGDLRVSLVTTHIPIRKVAQTISPELIEKKFQILAQSLKSDFGIERPKVAIFGLNPHAGDGGVIGLEEKNMITPLIQSLKKRYPEVEVNGPFPADGFFGQQLHKQYDAILAMYHDQGLAPFKLLSFGKGVNFTAGLPIIRTSPDHGTAFDIAGKGIANPSSFKEAYSLAVKLAKQRFSEP
ncbi:MAG: 4-hydroxythreonine-4-phosphate dehydrogenase PdxA [Gracilimonas sp.]|nr:4-hydroxythreonine-4-phosphate dehydrogenase PdxA [Gracilimonas sp.]